MNSRIENRYIMQEEIVSILETDFRWNHRYKFRMKEWVVKAMEHAGLKQAEMTRRLHTQFGWSENRSIFNKIITGERGLGAKEMYEISKLTAFPIPPDPLLTGQVAELFKLLGRSKSEDQEFALQIAIDYLSRKLNSGN